MLRENPNYQIVFHSDVHNLDVFAPSDIANGYHLSRYVAAGAQNIYSASGATKDFISLVTAKMIELCNTDNNSKTFKTDITALAHNLQYRTKYPVDEDCAIRMGAIYTFLEDENPDDVQDLFTKKKMKLAKGDAETKADPALYAFFLNTGIIYTPAWSELGELSKDYFLTRAETLNSLTPFNLLKAK